MSKFNIKIITIFWIFLFKTSISSADVILPLKAKSRIILEKIQAIDLRGNFSREGPDNSQENNISLKSKKAAYYEIGVTDDISAGFDVTRYKITSLYRTSPNFKKKRYRNDQNNNLQLNNDPTHQVKFDTYSYYDNEFFLKKKLYDQNNSLVSYQFGYNFLTQNEDRLRFNDKYRIRNKLYLRKYIKYPRQRRHDYIDMNFEIGTNPDFYLTESKFNLGIGKWIGRKYLMEAHIGFESLKFNLTYPKTRSQTLTTAKISLYTRFGKKIMTKVAIAKKFTDGINIIEVTTGLVIQL